jgi:hypothetical protein
MQPFSDAIDKDLQSRAARIQRARDAWEGNLTKPLKIKPNEPDHNRMSNRCKPIIMTNKSFLFGLPLGIVVSADDEQADSGKPSPAQQYLDATWGDDDKKMTLLGELYINGGVCGQGFLRLIEPNKAAGQPYPVIYALDPSTISVQTYPNNCKVVYQYAIQYPVASKTKQGEQDTFRQTITRNDPDGNAEKYGTDNDSTWDIETLYRVAGVSNWTLTGSEHWPYSWSPLDGCQNAIYPNQYWGMEDLTPDIIEQNDGINRTNSDIAKIIYYYGSPKTWVKGARASEVSINADSVLFLPNKDATIGALEAHGNIADAMAFASSMRSDMAEQSGVPEVAVGRMDQLPRAVTGVALRILYAPEMAATEDRRRLYGALIVRVSQHILELGKFGKDVPVSLHWQDPLPADDLAEAQTALAWQQLGVSDTTLMQRGGFDPKEEAVLKDAEDESKSTAFDRGQGEPPLAPQPMPMMVAANNLPQSQNDGGQGVQ